MSPPLTDRKLDASVRCVFFLVLMSSASLAVLNLLPLYFEKLGGSPRRIGILVGLFSLASFLSRPFVGLLLGRVEPRKVMILGLLLMLAVTACYPFIRHLDAWMVAVRALHGVGFSLFILAALFIVVLNVPDGLKTYALGVISAGFMLPLLIFPFIGEEIILRLGFNGFFVLAAVLVLIPFAYGSLRKISCSVPGEDMDSPRVGFLSLLFRRRVFILVLLTLVFETALSAVYGFVPLLAHNGTGMKSGLYYMFLGMMAVFLRLVIGRRFRIWGDARLIPPAFLFLAAGTVLLTVAFSNVVLASAGLIFGLGAGILYPHLSAQLVSGLPKREKSLVLSIFAAAVDLGFAVGPFTLGMISDSIGVRSAFLPFSLAVLFVSAGLMAAGRSIFRSTPHKPAEPVI